MDDKTKATPQEKKEEKAKKKLREEVKERTVGYIMGALGLVAGLAWNEAIKSLIDTFFPFSKDGILIKFVYAIVITIVIVVATFYLLKLIPEKKEGK